MSDDSRLFGLPRTLLTSGAVVVFGTLIGAVANYLFQRLMANHLGSEPYGELVALLNLLILFTIPASVIQLVANRRAGEIMQEHGLAGIRELSLWLLQKLWPIGLGLTALIVVAAPWFAGYLNLPSALPVMALAPTVLLGLALPVFRGALQGSQRFWLFAWSTTSEGIVRLLAGIVSIALGYALFGAIAAVIVGMALALIFSFLPLHFQPSDTPKALKLHIPWTEYATVAVILFVTSFYLSADVLFVKHYLPALAGQYAAVSTVAKYLFYFSSPVISVMFPLITAERIRGGRSLPLLFGTACLLLVGGLIVLTIFWRYPEPLLKLLFGQAYVSQASLLPLTGLMVLCYEMLFLLAQYFLAMRRTMVIPWLLLGFLVYILTVMFSHGSLVGLISGITGALALATLFLLAYGGITKRSQA